MNKAMTGMIDDSDLMKLVSEAEAEPPLDVTKIVQRWQTRKATASEPLTREQLSAVIETAQRTMARTRLPAQVDFLAQVRRCLAHSG